MSEPRLTESFRGFLESGGYGDSNDAVTVECRKAAQSLLLAESDALRIDLAAKDAELRVILDQVREAQKAMQQFKQIYPDGFPDGWQPQPDHLPSQVISLCNWQRCNFLRTVAQGEKEVALQDENRRLREAAESALPFIVNSTMYDRELVATEIEAALKPEEHA